jgi:hypothetical protein
VDNPLLLSHADHLWERHQLASIGINRGATVVSCISMSYDSTANSGERILIPPEAVSIRAPSEGLFIIIHRAGFIMRLRTMRIACEA